MVAHETTLIRRLRRGDSLIIDGPARVTFHRDRRRTVAVIRARPSVKIRQVAESDPDLDTRHPLAQ